MTVIALIAVIFIALVIMLSFAEVNGTADAAIGMVLTSLAFVFIVVSAIIKKEVVRKAGRSGLRSSDGHFVKRSEDLTCETNDGHNHRDNSAEYGRRYIVHNEPNEGYVVLNGEIRKIEDCRNL